MNLVDIEVIQVLSDPYEFCSGWAVDVMVIDESGNYKSKIVHKTKEFVLNIKEGYIYQA